MKTLISAIVTFSIKLVILPLVIAEIWGIIAWEFNLPPFGFKLFFLISLVQVIRAIMRGIIKYTNK